MRVCLTGGTGFLGREVASALLAAGHEVVHLARSSAPQTVVLDLLCDDPAPVLRDLRPDALVHLAWYAVPGRFWQAPENLEWLAASLRLVRAFAAHGGGRLITAGTCAEYDWSHRLLDEQLTPMRPSTLYGEAKASLCRMIAHVAGTLDLCWASGCIFFPYGPHEQPGRLFSSLFDGLIADRPVDVTDGLQVRDFLHVEDAAAAFVALLASDLQGRVNIAGGSPVAVRSFVAEVAGQLGRLDLVNFGARPAQPGEPTYMAAGLRRLRGELGFVPRFGLSDGIADAIVRRRHRPPLQR